MKFYLFAFLLVGVFFQACSTKSKEEIAAYELMNSFIKVEKKENNLCLMGIGTSMPDTIHKFNLTFVTYQNLNVNQARILFINSTQKLLDRVNVNRQIRPYLNNYPFNAKNLDFTIMFEDIRGNFVNPPHIAFVSLTDGKIRYNINDPITDEFNKIHSETYEEALRIVREQLQN